MVGVIETDVEILSGDGDGGGTGEISGRDFDIAGHARREDHKRARTAAERQTDWAGGQRCAQAGDADGGG